MMTKILGYCALALLVVSNSACSNQSGHFSNSNMAAKEAKFNQSRSQAVVAHMSLETMFTDAKVRALASAAADGDIDEIDALVAGGVDVNARGTRNATPLFWSMKSLAGYQKLLALGADANVVFDDGGSVIHWAMKFDDDAFIESALRHGGDANLVGGMLKNRPIFKLNGSASKLDILLKYGADINGRTQMIGPASGKVIGNTALIEAAGSNDFKTVQLLLDKGADPSLDSNNGVSFIGELHSAKKSFRPGSNSAKAVDKILLWLKVHKAL